MDEGEMSNDQMSIELEDEVVTGKDRPRIQKSSEVVEALRVHYGDKAVYAFFTEVGNSTGFKCNRHADVLVMSLWPSRGLEVIGFEVKVSRSDWKRELEHPEKADVIAQYCDRWFLAVGDENIVQPGELPATWGLYVPAKRGGLRCKVPAKTNEFLKPLDRSFTAAVLRSAQAQITGEAQLTVARDAGYQQGMMDGKKNAENEHKYSLERSKELATAVAEFEKASGVNINKWNGEKIGDAVRLVMNGAATRQLDSLARLKETAEQIALNIGAELEKVKGNSTQL
jgi:phage-related protein